jgi:hypothetical protein
MKGGSDMYVSVRKYRLKRSKSEVRGAVMTGLVPILRASLGFQAHWIIDCDDGDIAAVSIFDSEANAHTATDRALAWINANIRELVVLPPESMFSGEADQIA